MARGLTPTRENTPGLSRSHSTSSLNICLKPLSHSDVNKTFLSRPRPRPRLWVSRPRPRPRPRPPNFSRPRPRPRLRLFSQDQGKTFHFKTKIKTKTFLGPLKCLTYNGHKMNITVCTLHTHSCLQNKRIRSDIRILSLISLSAARAGMLPSLMSQAAARIQFTKVTFP